MRDDVIAALEAMVEGCQDGLWVLTGGGVVIRGNRAAERLLGLPRGDVVGRGTRDLAHAGGLDWSIATEVAEQRIAVTGVQHPAGGRTLLVSGRPILTGDGRVRYVVLTVRDVSEVTRLMARFQETARLSERRQAELERVAVREVQSRRIVARSAAMRAVWDAAVKYAAVDSPVLLLGETGTGKGVFAELIHQASARRDGPWLEVNCGAIPEGLVEAELFGYAKGAFTGADARGKVGLVELAHGGTLLLNEIGDLPLALQVKLLRFLEDGEIWPVGAVRGKRPDVRIVAATNRELPEMIARGGFRRDLFYRLNVLTIRLPPLRDHPEDIPWLVEMMLSQFERKLQRRRSLTPAAVDRLSRYAFPGNVRELWNVVERLVVTTSVDVIDVGDLPPELAETAEAGSRAGREGALRQAVARVEASLLREALARYGTQERAARHLGVGQATVARKAKRYGLRSS